MTSITQLTGSISLNKVELGARLPPSCTFVPQFDEFPPCLTVTEHLHFQATLRLGSTYTQLAKEGKVSLLVYNNNGI
jgi:ABC-type multidrug transport system ATPase subunit